MKISVDRVYNVKSDSSGGARKRPNKTQFLVDQLWPRGVKKEALYLGPDGDDAGWLKELTPSKELRERFHAGDSLSFEEFSGLYLSELDDRLSEGEVDDALALIKSCGEPRGDASGDGQGDEVVLLTATKNEEENHALVLRDWLEQHI